MSGITVFISYSHDSEEHRADVLALSERLRADGVQTYLDRYVKGSPTEGWPRWMLNQLDAAQFVLVVCTETYYRRFRGHEAPEKGKGVDFEGALITQEIYNCRSQTLKFVPVLFAAQDEKFIPEPLRAATHYTLTSEASYGNLYDYLLGQSGVEPGAVGSLKPRQRSKGSPLTFGESPTGPYAKIDISRIIKYAPAELIGREDEINLLNEAWAKVQNQEKGRPHILTFVALGGEGKTSLVAKWTAELAAQEWPGCDAAFAWSFYSQGTREQLAASSDLFLKEALSFFGDKETAEGNKGAFDKGKRLAQLVGERRSILILDGVEPLQYAPASPTPGQLKDQGIAALLKTLAAASQGLCVVTTRYSLPDLKAFKDKTVAKNELKRLSTEAGVHLLQRLGVRKESGSKADFEKLVEDVKGHALTLTLFAGFLKRAFHGDIRQRDRVKFEKADEKIDGGHAFRTMAAYERWLLRDGGEEGQREVAVLRLMGLFDRPAHAGCLGALRQKSISGLTKPLAGLTDEDWEYCLSGLETAKLLTVNRDATNTLISLDAHPLLREYFAKQLRTKNLVGWRAGHSCLYEHLCTTTPDKSKPTLEDLQPLYQAVTHGCQAGLEKEACETVYKNRILRGNQYYSIKELSAFESDLGALACFFSSPWKIVSPALPEHARALLLHSAATWLAALGRLTEAVEPMRAAMNWAVAKKQWKKAAVGCDGVSNAELTLGDVNRAVKSAELSILYADRSKDIVQSLLRRATSAKALHQAGRFTEAKIRFEESEQMRAHVQSVQREVRIYTRSEFYYCEFLLASPERAAWRAVCGRTHLNEQNFDHRSVLQVVTERATESLKLAPYLGSLDVALDQLTLTRSALYQAVLEKLELTNLKSELENAIDGLRKGGEQNYIIDGLLTSAWLRFLTGTRMGAESAESDLNEAWEIAARGPMKLHTADIHLYRARLFGSQRPENEGQKYPWESVAVDLAAAEKLINECGYHLRDEELADAKKAILGSQ